MLLCTKILWTGDLQVRQVALPKFDFIQYVPKWSIEISKRGQRRPNQKVFISFDSAQYRKTNLAVVMVI